MERKYFTQKYCLSEMMIYSMSYKITDQGWSELNLASEICLCHEETIPHLWAMHHGSEKQIREIICCGEMTISMQIPACSNISIYPLAIAVLIFFYAWSALDMSCLLTGLGSLAQTEDTQSAGLSLQCRWLVEVIHTVECPGLWAQFLYTILYP